MKRCSMCGLERELNFRGLCKRCEDIEKLMEDLFDKDAFSGNPERPFSKNVHQLVQSSKKGPTAHINNRIYVKKSPMAARLFPALAYYLSKKVKAV